MIAVAIGSLESRFKKKKYSKPLASWSHGLEIMFSNSVCKSSPILLDRLWNEACCSASPASWEVLLHHEIHLTSENWITICHRCAHEDWFYQNHDQLKALFFIMAKKLMPCNTVSSHDLETLPLDESKVIAIPVHICLYHAGYVPSVAAESAWEVGHRNVNQPGHLFRFGDSYSGTPLWMAAALRWFGGYHVEGWLYSKWLLDHGADPTWSHPEYRTTAAHCVGRLAVEVKWLNNWLFSLSDVQNLWTMEQTDECTCYCSREGCLVIACATSKHACPHEGYGLKNHFSHHRRTIRPYFYALVDHIRSATWMSSAILRILTFEELSLTHTCCYRITEEVEGWFTRPTSDETEAIHDSEKTEIYLLEDLMTEFEAAWAGYTKTFAKFINRVWKSRMRAIRKARRIDKELYEAELRRLGISDRKKGEGKGCESESDSESDVSESEESTDSEGSGWHTTDDEGELDCADDDTSESASGTLEGSTDRFRDSQHADGE
jgi:hypothetical protein